jgi:glycosyltransferase involved in cell wall biosynthesis
MKQPLIANFSQVDESLVAGLLVAWCNGQQILWATSGDLIDSWSSDKWPLILRARRLDPRNIGSKLLFWLFIPWVRLVLWFKLAKLNKQNKIDGIICLSWVDKILLTLPAKWLGLPVIWLQLPEEAALRLPAWLAASYRRQAAKAKVITYSRQLIVDLQLAGAKLSNWQLLWPAIDQDRFSRQGDLFDNLAENQRELTDKKYFVVGAVVDLVDSQVTEVLLRSLKIVLSVIPSVQLVIIGDGPKRKELQWLAKQLDLANLVWFVGRQEPLDKWFRSLDALIELSTVSSKDWQRLLQAMSVGLPIIAPKNKLTADFLLPGQTAVVVEKAEPEMIAQAVIQLQQDKLLAGRLGWQSKEWLAEFGTLERQLTDFTNYLQE